MAQCIILLDLAGVSDDQNYPYKLLGIFSPSFNILTSSRNKIIDVACQLARVKFRSAQEVNFPNTLQVRNLKVSKKVLKDMGTFFLNSRSYFIYNWKTLFITSQLL